MKTTETKTIKILILEHDMNDLELLMYELNKSELDFQTVQVETRADFIQAIHDFHPDIILSDYSLPSFDGLSAFKIAWELASEIPFIIVSGTIGEENAVELIKIGVTDYVIKEKMFHVIPKIHRALKEADERNQRKNATDLLKTSEKQYRYLFENNPLPMWIYDASSLAFLEVNKMAVKLYGYSKEEFLQMTIYDLRRGNEILRLKAHQKRKDNENKIISTGEWTHVKKNGKEVNVEVIKSSIFYKGKEAVLILIHDITEKKILQDVLLQEKLERQKQITIATIRMQEKEREVIGRELHDNVNQILTSAKLYLDYAIGQQQPSMEFVNKSRDGLNSAINEIRSLSKALVPPSIGDLGLAYSINDLTATIENVQDLNFDIRLEFQESELTDITKLTIFRIIQEQVTNIVKYARAKNVLVSLHQKNNDIHLIVQDDGEGFDPQKKRRGIGISNIFRRVESMDGHIDIITAPGKGCCFSVTLPLLKETYSLEK